MVDCWADRRPHQRSTDATSSRLGRDDRAGGGFHRGDGLAATGESADGDNATGAGGVPDHVAAGDRAHRVLLNVVGLGMSLLLSSESADDLPVLAQVVDQSVLARLVLIYLDLATREALVQDPPGIRRGSAV